MSDKRGKSILIVRLSAAGDVLHAMPAAEAIKAANSGARISWVVEPLSEPLVRACSFVDDVIVLDRKSLNREATNPLKAPLAAKRIVGFVRELRKRKFDLAVDFQGNLRSATVTFMSGAGTRIGFSPGAVRENLPFAYTQTVPVKRGIHKIKKNRILAAAAGADGNPKRPKLDFPANNSEVEKFIDAEMGGKRAAVLHPGVSRFGAFKAWQLEKYAALGDRIADELGMRVILTYGPGEEEGAAGAGAMMKRDSAMSPRTKDLGELGRILSRAALFVGADTGPLHLANALGVPTVGIYGPKDPVVYGPYFEPKAAVSSGVECAPCDKRKCKDAKCMSGIGVEEVFAAAKKIIGG